MSSDLDLEGAIQINSDRHTVEYEPGAMVGLSTLFLRVSGGKHNVPIHFKSIDDVIEMLQRGKKVIEALESKK